MCAARARPSVLRNCSRNRELPTRGAHDGDVRRTEGRGGEAAVPEWRGSAVAGVGFLIAALFHIALTQTANVSGVSTGALQSLAALDEHSWVAFNSGLGVMMLGAAGTLLASRTHRVLGWIALVAGIALFVPFADFVGLIVSGLWIITTSVQLYRSQPAESLARRPELA